MCSPPSSPNLLLDHSTIDDYDVCELDFIDPLTDHGQADSSESATADYLCSCLPPPSNDLASSDLLIHSQMGIGNSQPAVQLEESIISGPAEEINGNWSRLGFSFNHKRNSSFVGWKSINPVLPRFCKPQNYSSLQKRCFRFLNVIKNHKILGPLSSNEESSGAVPSNNYNKLAIHHVVAERKRRAKMGDVFSALRALVPVNPKVMFLGHGFLFALLEIFVTVTDWFVAVIVHC
jgi:hypothetical protein